MRAARIDANHKEIVDALRAAGATVQSIAPIGNGCPDLLCGFKNSTYLLELKDGQKPPSARELTPDQIEWHINWRGGPCQVVTSVEEALCAIGAIR